jgi:hypothetical protein
VIVGTVIIAVLGGFNDVPVEKLPLVQPGATHTGGEVDTTVTAIYLTTRAPAQSYDADDGMQYLVVEATLTNRMSSPSILGRDLVRVLLDGVIDPEDEPSTGIVDLRTGDQVPFLQPGLPIDVAWSWEIPLDAAAAGDDLIIGYFERFPIQGDPVFGDTAFTRPQPTARTVTTIGAQQ